MSLTVSFQDHTEAKLQQGLNLFHQNQFQQSLQIYHEIIKINPKNIKALLGVASNYVAIERHMDALEVIQEILKLEQQNYSARCLQVQSLLSLHQLEATKIVLDELKQNFPNKIEILQFEEQYLLDCQLYHKSTKVSLELTKQLPSHPSPYNNLGLAYLEQGEFAQSIIAYRTGLKHITNLSIKNSYVNSYVADQTQAKLTLLAIKKALDDLKIPFMLIAGTILGIYRDGDILPHDKDIDLALPWKTPRLELIQALKQYGFKCQYCQEDIMGLKGQYNIPIHHIQYNIGVDFLFAKPKKNGWSIGFAKGDSVISIHHTTTGTQKIQYAGEEFTTVGNIEGYLEETYGKDWRTPKPNYNTLILGENISDPDGIGILLCYNHCLGALCNENYKRAHGYCLQLLSVHNDPLLEQVTKHLEKYITNIEWYQPIPYRSKRTTNQELFGTE